MLGGPAGLCLHCSVVALPSPPAVVFPPFPAAAAAARLVAAAAAAPRLVAAAAAAPRLVAAAAPHLIAAAASCRASFASWPS